jgi:hypothetical protein
MGTIGRMAGARKHGVSAWVARALPVTVACAGLLGVGTLDACSSSSHGTHGAATDATAPAETNDSSAPKVDGTSGVDGTMATGDAGDATRPEDSGAPPPQQDSAAPPETGGPSEAGPSDAGDATAKEASVTDAGAASDATDAAVDCVDGGGLPPDLSCTGLYSDWATKTVAPGNVTYTPGYILWSDGAVKTRWISLPAGSQIDTSDMDDWVFPVGTRIWKQFVVGGQLIETRFMWKEGEADWTFADYLWSADLSSAPLLRNGETNVNGTTYEVPALSRCPSCHGGRLDDVLGFDLIGTGVSTAQGLTLAGLVAAGDLTDPPPAVPVVIPEDSTGMAAPALGWLHVNCGVSCHNNDPGSMAYGSHLYMKLLTDQMYPPDGGSGQVSNLDTYTTAVGVLSNLTPNGMHYMRIAPGVSDASLIPLMDLARGADASFAQMPPFVTHIPDTVDVGLVQSWINAL